jgi:sarcosine oxidase
MPQHFEAIVVGVGSMGAATCYQLARRGIRVLGLEQFNIPHDAGSHHGESRMIRLAYFEHPNYVPLLKRTYELWRELEADSNTQVLHITGGLYMGPPGSELVAGALESCREHDLAHEVLDSAELKRRFPQFTPPENFDALYEQEAGFLLPQKAVAVHAAEALKNGAELHGLERVTSWSSSQTGVTVTTTRDEYRADRVVFTGGAWTAALLSDLGVELKVTRQVLAWFAPRSWEPFAMGEFPVWFMETEPGYGHYGFPIFPGGLGFKVALHKPADEVDPEHMDRTIQPHDVAGLTEFLEQRVPQADGPLLAASVCLYTSSPDAHFIVDRLPDNERVTVACGFSGHGFKFAAVIGEVLADLAIAGRTQLPAEFLKMARFAN